MFSIKPLNRHLSLFVIVASLLVACDQNTSSDEISKISNENDQNASLSTDEIAKADLSQQLPLEFELSIADKEIYLSVLNGLYNELTDGSNQAMGLQNTDPTDGCDRCGRETGFLPSVDVVIDQFLHVEMKALTFGLISWEMDERLVQDVIAEFLAEDSPNMIQISYRITLVRVDMSSLSEPMIAEAVDGRLLSSESPEMISITSVDTGSKEIGLQFDHGYSYLLYINAVEAVSKLSSNASSPVFIHCFRSELGRNNGGCVQLNPNTSL